MWHMEGNEKRRVKRRALGGLLLAGLTALVAFGVLPPELLAVLGGEL